MLEEIKAPAAKGKKKSQGEQIDELISYIERGGSLGFELKKKLEELPQKYVVLVVTKEDKYDLLIANLLKNFMESGMNGIFVTLNKSGNSLIEMLKEHGVDCSSLFIVDVISKGESEEELPVKNISFVDSPQDLTEMQTEINEFVEKLPSGEHFFILDSLSTMLIYNAEKTVERFVHRLSERLRSHGFQSVFIIMDETRPEVINVLSQFCDKVIRPHPQISL